MRPNPVKQKIYDGHVSLGTFVFEFDSSGVARLACEAGSEFIVFDMEHTGWSVETIRTLLATTPMDRMVPMVRVPATEYHFIARVLDVGSMGIMVPMVETEEQARRIVSSAKYPPRGRRGAAFGIAHDDYQGGDIREVISSANSEQILIAQIETAEGVKNADAIASVEGIDVLWIGHFDLTNSLGIPGQFEHPDFLSAVQKVSDACQRHKKVGGFMAGSVNEALQRIEQGLRIVAYGGDLWLYQQTLRDGLNGVRGQLQ